VERIERPAANWRARSITRRPSPLIFGTLLRSRSRPNCSWITAHPEAIFKNNRSCCATTRTDGQSLSERLEHGAHARPREAQRRYRVDWAAREVLMKRLLTGTGLAILLFVPAVASAQILVAGEGPVVYGHHHLNTTNMDAQKKFYADTLGGSVAKIGSGDRQQEIVKFPNVLIFFRPMQAPTGGSIGTTVNHIGFSVPDLRPLVAKIKANGFKMITADSVAANVKVAGDIAAASPTTNLAFVLGPEDVKVELVEVKSQKAPIQLHHIHFFGQMNTEMQAWYAKTFGAMMLPANPASAFVQDQLPGVFLNFTPSPTPTVGTTGRSIDHIGFEIKNLEAFTKKLEAQGIKLDRPYTKVPQLGIAIAFIKDPWGTNIEMTEGLVDLN
jgi:predicted enzyme related to lactoylglutathione lyase